MNSGMQDGDNHNERKYFRQVIDYLPKKPLVCLDLGSGIGFAFENMLQNMKKDYIVDCVDRLPVNKQKILPKNVNYVQASVDSKLILGKNMIVFFVLK